MNDLTVVHDLSVPFSLECVKNETGIFGPVGIDLFTIKQFQSVQHGCSLLGSVLPGNCSQSVLSSLLPVTAGNQYRKERIIRSLVREMWCQANTSNCIHQITEINGFVGCRARNSLSRCAFCPFSH